MIHAGTQDPTSPSPADPRLVRAFALVGALALYKLVAQIVAGPGWDTYSFFANAAALAGRGYGYTEPARPPLISVVAAPLVRLGFMSPVVIQVVDFAFALLAVAGAYLLARKRVSPLVAAGAGLAVLVAPPVWEWIGVGYTDIGAVALCTWALLALYRATESDSRYYIAAFPLAVCAVLMRTTSLLFVFPIALWMLFRTRVFAHARDIALGILAALALYAPFGYFYSRRFSEPFYPFVTSLRIQQSADITAGVLREVGSYFGALPVLAAPRPLAFFTTLLLMLAVLGLALAAFRSLHDRHVSAGRIGVSFAIAAAAAWVAVHGGLLSTQVAIVGSVYLVWRLLTSEEHDPSSAHKRAVPADLALDAVVIAWLLGYYTFHEQWAQRVTRYYIVMAPQVAYLVALGWDRLVAALPVRPETVDEETSLSDDGRFAARSLVRFAWLPLVLVLAAGVAIDVARTNWRPDPTVADARKTAAYLSRQPSSAQGTVFSDMWPVTAFYARRNVLAMPFFEDARAFGHELDKRDAAYYITVHPETPSRFSAVFDTGSARVLKRDRPLTPLPRALYLGSGWENYLEELQGFTTYLKHEEGDYNLEGTAYYDGVTLEELKRYPYVVAFGGLWHDRGNAERLLMRYVEEGGTLVFDASGNLSEPTSLGESVLFDTVIARQHVSENATISLDPDFSANHPEVGRISPSAWRTETGEPWFGAGYSALPGSGPLRVLARLDGKPLVAERAWGKGRVIWVAYNLPWHAKTSHNPGEARLVAAILDEAARQRDR